jgi:predicted nucleotidyltransferase
MSIKQKILRFLIENKTRAFSIKEISKSLKIDYKLVYINIKKLEGDKSIEVEDLGVVKRCSFKDKFNGDVFIVESERKNQLLQKKEFRAIYDRLKILNRQFILLLFGSHAKGTAVNNSDIDLLAISDEENARLIEDKLEVLPLKIHLNPISCDSFIGMAKSKEQTVVGEALKKNIILFGLEDYYRLLENAENQ